MTRMAALFTPIGSLMVMVSVPIFSLSLSRHYFNTLKMEAEGFFESLLMTNQTT
jgi:hypothetical protein